MAMHTTRVKVVGSDIPYYPRYFSKTGRYGYAVGRIMVREATLLNRQQVGRLVGLDFRGAIDVTLETVYGPYLRGVSLSHEIDDGLMRFLVQEYAFMDEICAGTLVAHFMHMKYDFHNLRVILKRHYFADAQGDNLIPGLGSIPAEDMLKAAQGEKPTGVLPAYIGNVIAAAGLWTAAQNDPQLLDTLVDRSFLERRLAVADEERSRPLRDFCAASIDVANVKVMLRGFNRGKDREFYEAALAEGGRIPRPKLLSLAGEPFEVVADKFLASRYGRMLEAAVPADGRIRLTSLDKESDEYLFEQVKGLSKISMGPERIVRFMLTRESEVVMLRIIFMGKIHGLTPESIQGRIPEAYLYESPRQQ